MSDRTNKFSARIGWGMTICVLFAGQKHSFSDKTQFHLSVQQDALIALRKRSGHLKSFTSIPQHETSSSLARQSSTELQTYFPSFFFVFCFFFKMDMCICIGCWGPRILPARFVAGRTEPTNFTVHLFRTGLVFGASWGDETAHVLSWRNFQVSQAPYICYAHSTAGNPQHTQFIYIYIYATPAPKYPRFSSSADRPDDCLFMSQHISYIWRNFLIINNLCIL